MINKISYLITKPLINTKLRNPNMINEKLDVRNNAMTLLKGKEMVYNGFESRIFPLQNQSRVLVESGKSSLLEQSTSSEKFQLIKALKLLL